MRFTLTAESDHAAFADHLAKHELGYAIQRVATKISEGATEGTVRDSNGNTIGRWEVTY